MLNYCRVFSKTCILRSKKYFKGWKNFNALPQTPSYSDQRLLEPPSHYCVPLSISLWVTCIKVRATSVSKFGRPTEKKIAKFPSARASCWYHSLDFFFCNFSFFFEQNCLLSRYFTFHKVDVGYLFQRKLNEQLYEIKKRAKISLSGHRKLRSITESVAVKAEIVKEWE